MCAKKKSSDLFKNVISRMCLEIIYLIYIQNRFGMKWPTVVDMQTKSDKFNLYE